MVDPVPILPQSRTDFILNSTSLKATFAYSSSGVWVVSTIDRIPQVEIQVMASMEMETQDWETTVTLTPRERELFSVETWEFVDRTKTTNADKPVEEPVPYPTPFPMIIIAWNARGIVRSGFKENIKHLVHEHTPDIMILSEIKTFRNHATKIAATLPFDRFELAEPNGFSRGILLLWKSATVDFQSIGVDLHAIHGIVQVITSPFPSLFLQFMRVQGLRVG